MAIKVSGPIKICLEQAAPLDSRSGLGRSPKTAFLRISWPKSYPLCLRFCVPRDTLQLEPTEIQNLQPFSTCLLLQNGRYKIASRPTLLEKTFQRGSLWKMNLGVTMAHGDDHSTGKSWVKEAHYPTSPRHKTHCQAWQVQVDTRGEFRVIH